MKSIFKIWTAFSVALSRTESSLDAICQSACGLVVSGDECKISVAHEGTCLHLRTTPAGNIVYLLLDESEYPHLTVEKAKSWVMADENNCFAMYYENPSLKEFASYCAENNVCPNLFWNRMEAGNSYSRSFKLFIESESSIGYVNTASPVMCDYETAEKRHEIEHHENEVDPCTSLCNLSHSSEECKHVQRMDSSCLRLFWADSSRSSTDFSVRALVGTQVQVTVEEARNLLTPENETCESLCKANAACRKSVSFCSDNRTCKGLFFEHGAPSRRSMKVCFESECENDLVPVYCGDDASKSLTSASTFAESSSVPSGAELSAAGLLSVGVACTLALL